MTTTDYKILVVDDEEDQLDAIKESKAFSGYSLTTIADSRKALARLKNERYHILVIDYKMPGLMGDALLDEIKKIDPYPFTILLTAYAGTGLLEQLLNKKLIRDYVEKPLNLKKLKNAIDKAIDDCSSMEKEEQELARLRDKCDYYETEYAIVDQIAGSKGLRRACEDAIRAAGYNSTVLVTGETGTGKEVFAHLIHSKSDRKKDMFVPINCTTLCESLFESELFGTAKGAFTGAIDKTGKIELAHGGTLFLDEIGDMKPEIQIRFLRVLEEKRVCRLGSNTAKTVDFRLIAATSKNLEEMIGSGQFRNDLYHRINTFPITLPPLRERKEDIPGLIDFFVMKLSFSLKIKNVRVTPEAMKLFLEYDWPGNVRELRNVIERLMLLAGDNGSITEGLAGFLAPARKIRDSAVIPGNGSIIEEILNRKLDFKDMEKVVLRSILDDYCDGSISDAHRKTGIPMSRFYRLKDK